MGYAEKKAEADYNFRRMVQAQRTSDFPFHLAATLNALTGERDAAAASKLLHPKRNTVIEENQGVLHFIERKRNRIQHQGDRGVLIGQSITARLPGPMWPNGQVREMHMTFDAHGRKIARWTNLTTGEVRVASPRIDPFWSFEEKPRANAITLLDEYRGLIRQAIREEGGRG